MGCFHSTRRRNSSDKYVETLTLKRRVTKKVNGQNVKISISVIADPLSSDEEAAMNFELSKGLKGHIGHKHATREYHMEKGASSKLARKMKRSHSFRTVSYVEGRRFTKFPNMVGYKICLDCQEHRQDVLETVAPEGNKEMCRTCSLKNRKNSKKKHEELEKETVTKLNIATFANLLALTALDLTAPASDALLKNRKNTWIQLAGHPGGFAPAGPNTIWKKRYMKDNNETQAYEELMEDSAHSIVPMFYREVEYNSEYFIEIEDLLQHFHDPNIMDVKMGTRTFLESEVKNTALRRDLYEKMVALDPNAPTAEEKQAQSITKLRYMQFREHESSTADYGFRIEALRMTGEPPTSNLKRVKSKEQIREVLSKFISNNRNIQNSFVRRLEEIRKNIEESPFFMSHEIIGSSILFMYDGQEKCGAWIIDFSKTFPTQEGNELNHRSSWQLGVNHEDGFLFGLDNMIQFFSDIEVKQEGSESNTCSSHSSSEER